MNNFKDGFDELLIETSFLALGESSESFPLNENDYDFPASLPKLEADKRFRGLKFKLFGPSRLQVEFPKVTRVGDLASTLDAIVGSLEGWGFRGAINSKIRRKVAFGLSSSDKFVCELYKDK